MSATATACKLNSTFRLVHPSSHHRVAVSGDDKDDNGNDGDDDHKDGTPDEADRGDEDDGEEEDAEQDRHKNVSEGRLLGGRSKGEWYKRPFRQSFSTQRRSKMALQCSYYNEPHLDLVFIPHLNLNKDGVLVVR